MKKQPLLGKRILVVEDEYFIGQDLCDDLADAGAVAIGPAATVESALALLEAEANIDAAVLDVNLGGEMSFPVADALLARGVPFVIATGYSDGTARSRYPDIHCCEKPVELDALARILKQALGT